MKQGNRAGYDRVKRGLDVVVGVSALAVSIPVQAVTAGVVWAVLGRPVLFRQPRPGRYGEIFELVKFRTMRQADAIHVTNEQRLTGVGRVLRATSLDELPTLWNVIQGDMSLVGPRPLRIEYLACYSPEQARRHEVRPGVTGLAQCSGRNSLSWEEKFILDVQYVDNRSFLLDCWIIARSVLNVLRHQGVSPVSGDFVQPFTGTDRRSGGEQRAKPMR